MVVYHDEDRTGNHLGHFVPGMYLPFVDTTGKRYVDMRLDMWDSHTHFDARAVRGAMSQFSWIDMDKGKVI